MSFAFSTNESVTLERTIDAENISISYEEIWAPKQLSKCVDWIKTNNYKRVCLQFPDELLTYSSTITEQLKKESNVSIFILGDTSYGSCCVDEIAATHVNADSLIHFGHACLSKIVRLPTLYIFPEFRTNFDCLKDLFEKVITNRDEKIAVFFDVGYSYASGEITAVLSSYNYLLVGKLALNDEPDVLCWCTNSKDFSDYTCLYIGKDNQSLFNLSMAIKSKKWLLYDPQNINLRQVTPMGTQWMRRRYYFIEKCKDAQMIGIVVSTLSTKGYLNMVTRIQELAKMRGARTSLISVGKVNPAKLANFLDIDCFVLIGCPENTLYTSRDFFKPLISPFEAEMALNPSWRDQLPDSYCTDFKELLPSGKLNKEPIDNIEANENDISLITGRVRVMNPTANGHNPQQNCTTNVLQERLIGQLVSTRTVDAFQGRSWRGLDPALGLDEPASIDQGRSGIPIQYDESLK